MKAKKKVNLSLLYLHKNKSPSSGQPGQTLPVVLGEVDDVKINP